MIIVSKEEGAKWSNLGSLTELRDFYGTFIELCITSITLYFLDGHFSGSVSDP